MTDGGGKRWRVSAPAKINLALRVLGRRPDGYHDIDTLFQAVDLCDDVEVELLPAGLSLEVAFEPHSDAPQPDLGPIEENLAYRAAAEVLAEVRPGSGARLRLTKRIPVGAGLGGGSSDAAAVLRALAAALGGVSPGRLREIGASLGSDVPFFLGGSPLARGTGRGERLEPLPALPPLDIVLVSPPVAVSTREAYQTLGLTRTDGQTAADSSRMGLTAWEDLPELASNDFEVAIGLLHPQVPRALHALRSAGAQVALMTGSGSTCFGTFADPSDAAAAATELRHELGWACVAARTLADVPEVRQG